MGWVRSQWRNGDTRGSQELSKMGLLCRDFLPRGPYVGTVARFGALATVHSYDMMQVYAANDEWWVLLAKDF